MLVEIADFYGVDIREIIDGERKSKIMDNEVREVAKHMEAYAGEEKSKLLKSIQIISFVGVLTLLVSILLQTASKESIDYSVLIVTLIALVIMAVITLYVTGVLEKIIKNKKLIME